MKISSKGKYALEAVVQLAIVEREIKEQGTNGKKNSYVKLKEISESIDVSITYLEQIFMLLKKAKVVESARGANGGYRLAVGEMVLTPYMVLEAVEGYLKAVSCNGEKCETECSLFEKCMTRDFWVRVTGDLENVLNMVTIREIADRAIWIRDNKSYDFYI